MYANTVNTVKLPMLSLTFNNWKFFFFNKKAGIFDGSVSGISYLLGTNKVLRNQHLQSKLQVILLTTIKRYYGRPWRTN